MERGSARFEDITGTANGVDQFLLEWVIDFRAQSTDDHIHYIGVGAEIDVPDVLGNFLARDDFSGRTGELGKEQKFFRSEIERHPVPCGPISPGIDLQVFNLQLFATAGWSAAQERPDAREQLGESEWFH